MFKRFLFSPNCICGILIFTGIINARDGDPLIRLRPQSNNLLSDMMGSDWPIEAHMSTPQLIVHYGYPVQQHQVRTGDGYILTLFRIPHGKIKRRHSLVESKEPVLLVHGLFLSSNDWLLNADEPHNNLPMMLADKGYDVWVANIRGNGFSMRHVSMNPNDVRFWKFSFDEMGRYDVPAIVDYVLGATRSTELNYVGHSMGTTMFFVSFEYNPSLSSKIKKMVALCPTVYVGNSVSPGRALSSPMNPFAKGLVDVLNRGHMVPTQISEYLKTYGPMLCTRPMSPLLCQNIIFYVTGVNKDQISQKTLAMIQGHSPSDQSSQTLFHYFQFLHSHKYQAYDHGFFGNLYHYGSFFPREYNLANVPVPVYAAYTENDWFTVMKDTHRTLGELGNLAGYHKVNDTRFTHMDFLYGKDARHLVYDFVMESLAE